MQAVPTSTSHYYYPLAKFANYLCHSTPAYAMATTFYKNGANLGIPMKSFDDAFGFSNDAGKELDLAVHKDTARGRLEKLRGEALERLVREREGTVPLILDENRRRRLGGTNASAYASSTRHSIQGCNSI